MLRAVVSDTSTSPSIASTSACRSGALQQRAKPYLPAPGL
jgi:hypothetical protein